MPLFSLPMMRLPVELLDNIADLAITLGTAGIKDVTLICPRWRRRYQGKLYKTVKLDPFSNKIPDLSHPDYEHLIPYIEELRVVHRSDTSTPPNYERDVTERFTNFLLHAQYATSLLLCDTRIRWEYMSNRTVDAFCTVFRRNSFCSLEISMNRPVPSWVLLHGVCVASDLTVRCIWPIIAPLGSVDLASYQCSLTRLVLFEETSIRQVTVFCQEHQALANELLRHVVELVLDCKYPLVQGDAPYPRVFLSFLAPQLKVLDLRIRYKVVPPSFVSAVERMEALQHLSIYLDGPLASSAGRINTMKSIGKYMELLLSAVPCPSPVKSISLKINDRKGLKSGVDVYQDRFHDLFHQIYEQVCYADQMPCLASADLLMNVNDVHLMGTLEDRQEMPFEDRTKKLCGYLQVNIVPPVDFGVSAASHVS